MMAKQGKGKKVYNTCKGVLTRLLFLLHGAVSIYLLYNKNNLQTIHFLLVIPMVLLVVESVITLYVREGKETKYVWPCGLFYIANIVPIIWVLELGLLEKRQDTKNARNSTVITAKTKEDVDGLLLDVMRMTNELDGRKVCEIGVIILIILGRWLTPRSSMSRNQLSNLLLGYVANAADIMELFESLKSPGIIYHRNVTIGVLVVYSWSLLQFTLVTTATMEKKKSGKDSEKNEDLNTRNKISPKHNALAEGERNTSNEIYYTSKPGNPNDETDRGPSYKHITSELSQQNSRKTTQCCHCCKCHPEFFQIFVTLLMQDGPFLMLRLALCIRFNVITELHIFFLCKNAIVCILLVYRLMILCSKDDIELDNEYIASNVANDIDLTTIKDTPLRNDNLGIDNPVVDIEKHNARDNPAADIEGDNPAADIEGDNTADDVVTNDEENNVY